MAFVTLPLLATLGFELLLQWPESVPVPVGQMMIQLFVLLLLPTVAVMWVRYRFAALVQRIGELLLVAGLFSMLAMTAGAAIARGLAQRPAARFAFIVEYATRNLGIATVVGATLLGHTELVVFAAALSLTQVSLMLAAVTLQRMRPPDQGLP
jgi:predicted Na+-dependent transporter